MDASVALLAVGSFIVGLLVLARVASWVAGLIVFFRPAASSATGVRSAGAVAQVFLHSGPWALAIAVAAVYYVATSSSAAYLWSMVGGLGLAFAFVAFATLRVLWRQRSVQPKELPLTPERFLTLRRRFFWRNSLLFAVAIPGGIALTASGEYERGLGFLLFVCLAGGLTGWLWSWFMWQWVGEALKVKEKARQRRERENAV